MRKTIFKILAWSIALVVALVLTAVLLLNTRAVQQHICRRATAMLSERLQARVGIDSIDVSLAHQNLRLFGLHIDDQQQRPLLTIAEAGVSMDLWALLKNRVVVHGLDMRGAHAQLLKPGKDEPANFQFLIDAFKPGKPQTDAEKDSLKKKEKLAFDVRRLTMSDILVRYNNATLQLASLSASGSNRHYQAKAQLHIKTDNHRPRKNTGKPHRGYFDVGHFDVSTQLQLRLDLSRPDTVCADVVQLNATDSVMGIDIDTVRAYIKYVDHRLLLSNIRIRQKRTVLDIDSATMVLPRKKGRGGNADEKQQFGFQTGTIVGTAYLQDISRAFAPVLSRFSMPLQLTCTMSGNDSTMAFRNVRVNTRDKRLTIAAKGDMVGLKRKETFNLTFRVGSMKARNGIAEEIIRQFPVKKMMMKQLRNLGDISYKGHFRVVRKKQRFWGRLNTAAGALDFDFWLDGRKKYVEGTASADSLLFGQVMDLPHFGPLKAWARFKIDISKPRTRAMRQKLGGKLPIGQIEATVVDCKYRGVRLRNLSTTVASNGAVATGKLFHQGKRHELFFSYSFTNTDEMRKMKITKPGFRFRKKKDD